MDEFDKILEEIREVALEHSEPYDPQAWEQFKKKREKRKLVWLWRSLRYSAVAACVGILFFIYIFQDIAEENVPIMAGTELTRPKSQLFPLKSLLTNDLFCSNYDSNLEKIVGEKTVQHIFKRESEVNFSINENKSEIAESNPSVFKQDSTAFKVNTEKENNFKAFTEVQHQTENKRRNKISYGLSVASLFTNHGNNNSIGISTGVNADFPVHKLIALNTGVIVSRQNITSNRARAEGVYNETGQAFQFWSFEIPLNVKLKLFRKKQSGAYLLAGVSSQSYFNIKNTIKYQITEVVGVSEMVEGEEMIKYVEVLKEKELEQKEAAFRHFDLAGTLNLGYGYERGISNKLKLTIEPYIKIPLSDLTNQDFKYTNTGIRFIISQ